MRLTCPGGVTDLTVTATPWLGGRVTISGRGANGDTLTVDGTRVSGLTVGRNTITLGVTAEDGVARAEYSVAVHRDAPTGSVALDDLPVLGRTTGTGLYGYRDEWRAARRKRASDSRVQLGDDVVRS